jgi:hypothetical protein
MVSRQIPADADVHVHEAQHPPPPAYSAIASAPALPNPGNRPELPVRVRNPQLQYREFSLVERGSSCMGRGRLMSGNQSIHDNYLVGDARVLFLYYSGHA